VADVFISYAHNDHAKAVALAQEIEGLGFTVWWDRELIGGSRYAKTILDQLNAASTVLVIWSPQSVRSGFVEDEARRALAVEKLIQLRTEDLKVDEIPLGFGSYQMLAIGDIAGVARAIRMLRKSILPYNGASFVSAKPQELIDAVHAALSDARRTGHTMTVTAILDGQGGVRVRDALEAVCKECHFHANPRIYFPISGSNRRELREMIIALFLNASKINSKIERIKIPYELAFEKNINPLAFEIMVINAVVDQGRISKMMGLQDTIQNLVGTLTHETPLRRIILLLIAATPIDQKEVQIRYPLTYNHPSLPGLSAALSAGALCIKGQQVLKRQVPRFTVVGVG